MASNPIRVIAFAKILNQLLHNFHDERVFGIRQFAETPMSFRQTERWNEHGILDFGQRLMVKIVAEQLSRFVPVSRQKSLADAFMRLKYWIAPEQNA